MFKTGLRIDWIYLYKNFAKNERDRHNEISSVDIDDEKNIHDYKFYESVFKTGLRIDWIYLYKKNYEKILFMILD